MKVGYARVSTIEQNLNLQTDALERDGCDKIFTDTASGSIDRRPGSVSAVEFCRAGDSLVVWKLDRLRRSLRHLIDTVNRLQSKGAPVHFFAGKRRYDDFGRETGLSRFRRFSRIRTRNDPRKNQSRIESRSRQRQFDGQTEKAVASANQNRAEVDGRQGNEDP
jgi:DNA invertase Pin-like site-specific DNA recombinase